MYISICIIKIFESIVLHFSILNVTSCHYESLLSSVKHKRRKFEECSCKYFPCNESMLVTRGFQAPKLIKKKKAANVIHMNCAFYTPKNKKGVPFQFRSIRQCVGIWRFFRETPFTEKY